MAVLLLIRDVHMMGHCLYPYFLDFLMRNARIKLLASHEQHELITHAAALLGKSPSDFVLDVVCEHAQVILCDQIFFGLDRDQFRAFTVHAQQEGWTDCRGSFLGPSLICINHRKPYEN